MGKPSFEDNIDFINNEINKRKVKWNLGILAWLDYEDVAQIIRIHIFRKWHLYDKTRPLAPWVNRVISSQMKNLIRNNYSNYCRPCLRCAAAEGDDGCAIYSKQCSKCPMFSNWEKTKKAAYETKLPVSLELHLQEVHDKTSEYINIDETSYNIHKKMESVLRPVEYRVYKALYIDHKSEEEAAKIVGYKNSQKGRSPGYKQIKNIQKIIIKKVKACFENDEIDIVR